MNSPIITSAICRSSNYFAAIFLSVALCFILASCDVPGNRKAGNEKAPTEPVAAIKSIHELIHEGDTTGFIGWLNRNPDLNERYNLDQSTPLISAARANRSLYIKDLLNKGADTELADISGQTALDVATSEGNEEIIRMLTEAKEKRLASLAKSTAPSMESEAEATSRAVLLSTDFRVWTSATGDKLDAAYIQSIFDTVILQNRDGVLVRIGLNRLIPEDQVLVRKLSGLDPHALAGSRGTAARSKRQFDSLALRIGQKSGWTVLENCRLLKNSANDGDSFHVQHDGKEYIFRLYFVDSAETNNDFPDRVKDQAAYFRLSPSATLRLGNEAAKFSTSLLASSPFTVLTRWEDARGNSSLPRYYAMVVTPLGDLDELLSREGLVRQYGMQVDGNLGSKKSSELRKLEQEAKDQEAGAWVKTTDRAGKN